MSAPGSAAHDVHAGWRFGSFELRPGARLLQRAGEPVALGARAFDMLVALVEGGGALLTKQELLDRVWAGLVVEEANLSVQMSTLRKALGNEVIATIPGRGYRFVSPIDALSGPQAAPSEPSAPAGQTAQTSQATAAAATTPPRALPQLLGRTTELERLRQDLAAAAPMCITLAGPAGVGKTALARRLAAQVATEVVWVDLAPVTEADGVAAALARALGISEPDDPVELASKIGARLLVFDNAEQVAETTAVLVDQWLGAQPALRVLVTSQRPLALQAERVHRIQPLALPRDEPDDLQRDAVALLVERIRAVDARLRPGAAELPLLRELVRRLDGLPLAIEMAAARVPLLGLGGVLQALDQRFALLTGGFRTAPGRHRSLHAALEWSHAMLGEAEQRLFRNCAVFAGGFTLELLVAVAGDGEDEGERDRWSVIDALEHLVDQSLVAVSQGEPPRYYLLESLREFAAEHLATAADASALRQRHAEALLHLARTLHVQPVNHRRATLPVFDAEYDNLREAMAWATRSAPALAAELGAAIGAMARFLPWRAEAASWMAALAPRIDDPAINDLQRARWWGERAAQQMMSFDPGSNDSALRARRLFQALGDDRGLFNANAVLLRIQQSTTDDLPALRDEMHELLERHPEWPLTLALNYEGAAAFAAMRVGDLATVLKHRERELELSRRLDYQSMVEANLCNIVAALCNMERHDEALARSNELFEHIGDSDSANAAYAWDARLSALVALGRLEEARHALPSAARLALRYELLPYVTRCSALLLALEDRPEDAARLLGHSDHGLAQWRLDDDGTRRRHRQQALQRALPALGAERFAALLAEGAALSGDEVLRLLGVDSGAT